MDLIKRYSLKKYDGTNGFREYPDVFMLEAFGEYDVRLGYIKWVAISGEIRMIWVNEAWQRRGLATHLYQTAQGITAGRIMHSERRTADGEAWARHVGGDLPRLHPTHERNQYEARVIEIRRQALKTHLTSNCW